MSDTNPKVQLETNKGTIVIELDAENAPNTVENFLEYVNKGFYDGTIFHRVIRDFMIPIKNEANNGLKNDKGTIAMARTSNPHSATAQFFINVNDNDFLNFSSETPQGWGYAVFGKVTEGMDVVEAIELSPTANKGMHQDVPVVDVVIKKATLVE